MVRTFLHNLLKIADNVFAWFFLLHSAACSLIDDGAEENSLSTDSNFNRMNSSETERLDSNISSADSEEYARRILCNNKANLPIAKRVLKNVALHQLHFPFMLYFLVSVVTTRPQTATNLTHVCIVLLILMYFTKTIFASNVQSVSRRPTNWDAYNIWANNGWTTSSFKNRAISL